MSRSPACIGVIDAAVYEALGSGAGLKDNAALHAFRVFSPLRLHTMTLKRTDLARRLGLKINNAVKQASPSGRLAQEGPGETDRRTQRRHDRALGLVPFAVKLPQDLVAALHARAEARGMPLAELTAGLLRQALERD
ncbi:MAG TPA: hypothetical protein PK974_06875 [Rhodocyclaceae bacterium]|nr:hypothetical protein [Rhodocyclaceae bacterium]